MFESHPVPQNISSYQFRLVGDMTLKQFFQLAAGVVVALLFYALPLPALLRWPLVGISVLAGAAFAFLPVQERPLEEWITAFFRSIYSPTLFVWKNYQTPPQYFQTAPTAQEQQATATEPAESAIETAHPLPAEIAKLEAAEESYLSRITNLIKGVPMPLQQTQPAIVQAAPQPTGQLIGTPLQGAPAPTTTMMTTVMPTTPKQVTVPQVNPVTVEKQTQVETATLQTPPTTREGVAQTSSINQTMPVHMEPTAAAAQFSPQAAPPIPPTQPNIIVGQVIDAENKIVDGAILEITDEQGRPVRALKSNKAGHFRIVTPLPNGMYRIATEKEGLSFQPVSIELVGSAMQPIAIRASKSTVS
ncbi:hypothetical protein A2801_01680 [Candidatus Woesebacteria bacterium RIFCSPHIGHO2_01_FULL_41_10]|uniref:PrgI family protein n=1 Tax=Candidatus Woesebacteria bacterium RIFCSPHIGHO2_01_FULL_41_10 TaxID=1802500 RepID=A0A1F7YMR4_9BACT|nr:MAG: hypothetical protein A2801_01680 [Candidatus Woesebacteria bacterium RIFCSPHIGHO2_01_FULL_41_10]